VNTRKYTRERVSSWKRALKVVAETLVAGTVPAVWRFRPAGGLLVLMYHRVLPPEASERRIEQPGMYVSPVTLDLHFSLLKRYFEFVHLDDWLRRAGQREELPRIACAITFDDGWRDNFEHALPVLRKYHVPATIFLVSGYTGTAREFWPNRLGRLLLAEVSQPGSVEFPEPLRRLIEPVLQGARRLGAIGSEAVDCAIAVAKQLEESQIRDLIARTGGRGSELGNVRDVLDQEEIRAMADSGLVRFGSHTRTHYRLRGEIAPEVLHREIVESRAEIAASCGQPVNVFCYPNGDMTASAENLVRQHYRGAVTTSKGWHGAHRDPFRIRRIGVHEDISSRPDSFLARITGWL